MKYVFLGFGPSNLFSVIHLMNDRDNKYFDGEIIVIDQGPDPVKRTEDNLLYGFGGAGFWSDGKYVFSNHPDIVKPYPKDKAKYHKIIYDILYQFHPHPEFIKEFPIVPNIAYSIPLRQSHIVHIGSDNNKDLGLAIYDFLLKSGVKFYFNTKMVSFNLEQNILYTDNEEIEVVEYDFLQIGLGKAGSKDIENFIATYNLTLLTNNLHIGGRFETKFNNKIEEVASIQHDFKFVKQYGQIEMRTFCANNKRAYVVQEFVDGRVQYNGHGYSEKEVSKINNLTNFGILASFPVSNLELEQQKYLDFGKNAVYFGKNIDFVSSLKINEDVIPLEKAIPRILCGKNPFPNYLRDTFSKFVDELNILLELRDNYIIWFPEVKFSLGILDVKEDFTLADGRFPNVNWVGDSCVGTRGIVPSAVSGLIASEKYLNI